MSSVNQAYVQKFCYLHLLSGAGELPVKESLIHLLQCNGYDRGPNSKASCINFVSIDDVRTGLCAYEQRARNGLGESRVRDSMHHCEGCNSNHSSGRDHGDYKACTAYTPISAVISGLCAWHIRSERLVDLFQGDRTKLNTREKHCLEECDASRNSCNDYIDVKHVVQQTCVHKLNLYIPPREGEECTLEGLCTDCPGKCDEKKCLRGYKSVTACYPLVTITPLAAANMQPGITI